MFLVRDWLFIRAPSFSLLVKAGKYHFEKTEAKNPHQKQKLIFMNHEYHELETLCYGVQCIFKVQIICLMNQGCLYNGRHQGHKREMELASEFVFFLISLPAFFQLQKFVPFGGTASSTTDYDIFICKHSLKKTFKLSMLFDKNQN